MHYYTSFQDKIDYIKVIDNVEGDTHFIVLQVAINDKENQDVAVFSVSKDENKQIQIQLIYLHIHILYQFHSNFFQYLLQNNVYDQKYLFHQIFAKRLPAFRPINPS